MSRPTARVRQDGRVVVSIGGCDIDISAEQADRLAQELSSASRRCARAIDPMVVAEEMSKAEIDAAWSSGGES